ncbi:869_t:CDS:2, partial [Funneliformis caledonium]
LVLPDDLKDLSDNTSSTPAKKVPARRTRRTIKNVQQEENLASTPAKKALARRTRRTIQNQEEDSASTPVKRALESTRTQKTNQRQNIQQEENIGTNRKISPAFAQELLKGFSSSDDDNNDFDALGLSSPAKEQWKKSEPYDLLDNEPTTVQDCNIIKSLPNSFTLLTNNKNNHIQATIPNILQKIASRKTNEEIQHKAEDIEINLNLQQKRPTQFQNMSNDFKIAHWTTLTSLSRQQISIENVLSPPEIEQELVIQVYKIAKTDYRLNSLTKDVAGWFNTYRYKFHISIVKFANEFKIAYEQEPYDELNEFITEDVWRQ